MTTLHSPPTHGNGSKSAHASATHAHNAPPPRCPYPRRIPPALPPADTIYAIQTIVGHNVALIRDVVYGWSQGDLAQQSGLSTAIVSNVERGVCGDYDALERIADAYGVSIYVLYPSYRAPDGHYTPIKDYGEAIRGVQETKRISNRQIMDALDIHSARTITALRKSVVPTKYARAYQLAQILGVDISDICPVNRNASVDTDAEVVAILQAHAQLMADIMAYRAAHL